MNNYNFDYVSYLKELDTNYKAGNYKNISNYQDDYLKNMNYKNNPGIMTLMNHSQGSMSIAKNDILDPYEGFKRGNTFGSLYDQYKNYKPSEINPKTERESMLNQLQMYNFVLTDLNLYLDTHPQDSNTVKLYNSYLNMEKQLCEQYERTYGPLTTKGSGLNGNNWNWIKSPWPWEEIK